MIEFLLSWHVGIANKMQGGRKKGPNWNDIEKVLLEAWNTTGTVTIDIVSGRDIGPQRLQVQTENRMAIITLGVDNGEDYIVRSYSSSKSSLENVEILGNLWAETSICSNYDDVIRSFKEFFENGDVSGELLS